MTTEQFRQLALSFPNTIEAPHFDRAAFKVIKKRIFATMHTKSETVNLKLSPLDQSVFCSFGQGTVYPVPNKWGIQGWTTFDLQNVPEEFMKDALTTAHSEAIKPKA
jgi:hypothetical protein